MAEAADVLAAEVRIRERLADLVAERARPVVADIEAQLGRLLTPGFVVTVGVRRLGDLRRYLRAIEHRLERLDVERDCAAWPRSRRSSSASTVCGGGRAGGPTRPSRTCAGSSRSCG